MTTKYKHQIEKQKNL